MLTKQETLLGRGAWVENRRVKEPRRTALCHVARSLGCYGDGISFATTNLFSISIMLSF